MFGSKNKKTNSQPEQTTTVDQDLVVRNMPNLNRLSNFVFSSPASSAQSENGALSAIAKPKHNFKMVGLIIILGGLIFIGGLVYLSYVYIIKPQTSQKTAPIVPATVDKTNIDKVISEQRASITEQIIVATTSAITAATSTVVDTTASSAPMVLNEELTGKQNISFAPVLDEDSDGLTDDEELILGTNGNVTDSNGNTYADLLEINNNYDPAGKGRLSTNVNLAKYINKTFNYEILYPKAWKLESLNKDATIVFTAADDSIIQVSVQDNSDAQSILGWYGNSFPDITITYDKLKTTENWDGIFGKDNLNFYLTDKKRTAIYVVSYLPAIDGRLAYPNIFQLMINSLFIK